MKKVTIDDLKKITELMPNMDSWIYVIQSTSPFFECNLEQLKNILNENSSSNITVFVYNKNSSDKSWKQLVSSVTDITKPVPVCKTQSMSKTQTLKLSQIKNILKSNYEKN
jgi:hypothetical protein